jgi:hypothetical protein
MTQGTHLRKLRNFDPPRSKRALSERTLEPEAKWGFAELASKWEAEAVTLELGAAD